VVAVVARDKGACRPPAQRHDLQILLPVAFQRCTTLRHLFPPARRFEVRQLPNFSHHFPPPRKRWTDACYTR
jgi:hypothetical protein